MELMTYKILYRVLIGICCLSFINGSYASVSADYNQLTNNLVDSSDAIAGGLYFNNVNATRPLLANSHDGGTSWFYPATITSTLPLVAANALFTGANCSRLNCVASGYYEPSTGPSITYPLLASSHDGGDTWTYPSSIISLLPSNFSKGSFKSPGWCSGQNCIAAGSYTTNTLLELPLLASSHDAGSTWTYPATITTNLPLNFLANGFFNASTCRAMSCIATGQYQNTANKRFPLLSYSSDGSSTWTYPSSIILSLPSDFKNAGIFNSASCSVAACVAGGLYTSTNLTNPHYPLLAVSHDNGASWSYPASPVTALPTDFVSLISLSSVSCNANNCIAVGQYKTNIVNVIRYPFLLSSQDGGNTWIYPPTVITNLPVDFLNTAIFNGAHCNRNICIAVGQYKSNNLKKQFMPLLASSSDNGQTWSYPSSIFANLTSDTLNGVLFDVSCNRTDCVAEGQYQSTNAGNPFYPLIATSHNLGVTWTYPPTVVSNLPSNYSNNGILTGGNSSFH